MITNQIVGLEKGIDIFSLCKNTSLFHFQSL